MQETPDFIGDPGWIRTSDLQLRRLLTTRLIRPERRSFFPRQFGLPVSRQWRPGRQWRQPDLSDASGRSFVQLQAASGFTGSNGVVTHC